MRVYYRSGTVVNRDRVGETIEERRTMQGRPEYRVRWSDGEEGWYLASNLSFGDGRATNGGARPGAGRVGKIAEAASRVQQLTGRSANRAALDTEQLTESIAALRAALHDLEAEAASR